MRYSSISATVLALLSSVLAQTPGFDVISSPAQDQTVAAGASLDIIWAPDSQTGTVTITLLQGATASTLALGPVIASGVDNTLGNYTWAIPSTEGSFATYGFEISLDSAPTTFQYSFPFHITGTSSSSASGSTTSTTTGTGKTTTIQLSTGPSYTSSASSTIVSTTSSSSSVVTTSTAKSISNSTLSTASTKATTSKTSTTSSSTGAPAATGTNGAISNVATGGLAMFGGLLLALAL